MKHFLCTGTFLLVALCVLRPTAALAEETAAPAREARLELPRDQASWTGEIPPGKTIEVKSILGPIRVEPAEGSTTTVEIKRVVPAGVPDEPVIQVVSTEKGVTICPVYPPKDPNKPNQCVPGRGKGRMKSELWEKGVTFEYVVHVPAGVSFAGETQIGTITGTLLESDVDVRTFRSEIRIVTGRSTKAEAMAPVTVQLAPSQVERKIKVEAANATARVLVPARTRYWYSLETAYGGKVRAHDGPKIEVNGQSQSASNSGGPSSGPKTTILVSTKQGDAVIARAPD